MALVGVFSVGILRIPHLDLFLAEWGRPVDLRGGERLDGELAAIAGWGYRPTAVRARLEAERRGLPYLALEDGFLRSIELGVSGGAPWSLIVDDRGVYYDCAQPSRLEQLIMGAPAVGVSNSGLLQMFRRWNLSKYNGAPDHAGDIPGIDDRRPLVVVLDQVVGDVSVAGGHSDAKTFADMLTAALDENPGAQVAVRSHPDVVAGRRQGYLFGSAQQRNVPVLGQPTSWPSLATRSARVYTATSLGGFEALVHGVPVVCFGLPFYAGWGLTEDRMSCPRRQARPSVESVFHCAYERYPAYVDLVCGRVSDAATVARRFAAARAAAAADDGPIDILGASRRKRRWVPSFVGSRHRPIRFARLSRRAVRRSASHAGRVLVWAAAEPGWLAAEAARHGVRLARIEDGFLRSIGLGAEFAPALSVIVDDLGIYFDPSRESRLERLLNEGGFTAEQLESAQELRTRLVTARLSKYNVGNSRPPALDLPPGKRRLLVPGQVENDASIRLGAPSVRTNLALLSAVRAEHPEAVLLYKPHPDVERGLRPGKIAAADLPRLADAVLSNWDAPSAIDIADEVHTMTSLLGFEALLRGRNVVTYGLPFYAGLGLTTDRLAWPRPRRPVTLAELVAATLLIYPRYRDPRTRLPITVFDAIDILERMRADPSPPSRSFLPGGVGASLGRLLRPRRRRDQGWLV